jgi:hypothetical protein
MDASADAARDAGLLWRNHPRHLLDLAQKGNASLYVKPIQFDPGPGL